MERLKVIDISYVQQKVDFAKVKAAGYDGVIIRTGYLGKTDTMFRSHMEGAIAAGLNIGVYTYLIAENSAQAALEAQQTITRLAKYKGHISYPVFCDMEHSKYYDNNRYSCKTRTDMIEAFCSTIAGGDYYPAVYINPSWLEEWTEKERILGKYDIWLAAWTENPDVPTCYNYGQAMWQWGAGRVDGVDGKADGNLCYVNYPKIIRNAGKNFLTERCIVTAVKEINTAEMDKTVRSLEAMGFSVSTEYK